jgi:hypothetical protein
MEINPHLSDRAFLLFASTRVGTFLSLQEFLFQMSSRKDLPPTLLSHRPEARIQEKAFNESEAGGCPM